MSHPNQTIYIIDDKFRMPQSFLNTDRSYEKVRALFAHCSHLPHRSGGEQYEWIAASMEIKLAHESLPARPRDYSEKAEGHIGQLIGPVHSIETIRRLSLVRRSRTHNFRNITLTHFPTVLHHPALGCHAFRVGLVGGMHWTGPRKTPTKTICWVEDTTWKC